MSDLKPWNECSTKDDIDRRIFELIKLSYEVNKRNPNSPPPAENITHDVGKRIMLFTGGKYFAGWMDGWVIKTSPLGFGVYKLWVEPVEQCAAKEVPHD